MQVSSKTSPIVAGAVGLLLGAVPVLGSTPSAKLSLKAAGLPAELGEEAKDRALAHIQQHLLTTKGQSLADSKIHSALVDWPSFEKGAAPAPLDAFQVDDVRGELRLEIFLDAADPSAVKQLAAEGLNIGLVDRERGLVVAGCSLNDLATALPRLAGLPGVRKIRPIYRGITRVGSQQTEGDAALGADQVRNLLGYDGSGVTVCAISDGVESAAVAASTGDLPSDGAGGAAIELCPLNANDGDEGTAMLEIIHDLAPGATLGFCPAFGNGEQGLADAVTWLAEDAFGGAGCDVIVDDVAFLTEPYFQDGVVAQAIDAAVASGSVHFSASGNSAQEHYQAWYRDVDPFDDSSPGVNLHDFGRTAFGPSDVDWAGLIAGAGTFVATFLQWEEPFGGAGNNFDLFLFDQNGRAAGDPNGFFPVGFNGLDVQNGDDDPLEIALIQNFAGGNDPFAGVRSFFIVVVGPGDSQIGLDDIEIHFNSNNGLFSVQALEDYTIPEDAVFGGAAAAGAITVGATGAVTNIDGTPNPNLDIIEPTSSYGPVILKFDPQGGNDLDIRFKPEITAVDGVSVTGVGFVNPFFGTSAAAPHAAGVAALLQQAAGGNLEPRDYRFILQATAESRSDFIVWGAGLIDALAAVQAAEHFCW